MPVKGLWKVIKSPGHAKYAFDLLAIDEESRKSLSASRLQYFLAHIKVDKSYSWGQPVHAPVKGIVVDVSDGWSDRRNLNFIKDLWNLLFNRPKLNPNDIRPFAGNYIIIQSEGFYVFIAHLQQNSIKIKKGDQVEAGHLLGKVGNSGFTLEPHLHFQLLDQINDLTNSNAPPFLIAVYERLRNGEWELVRNVALKKGEIIRN